MRDAELGEMRVEVAIVGERRVVVADDLADFRFRFHDGGVLLRQRPRAVRPEIVRIAAEDVLIYGAAPSFERAFLVQRAREHRDRAEKVVMLEAQPRRAEAAHAEALDEPPLARGDRAKGCINVRDEFLHHDGFHRRFAVLRVAPHAVVESVHEHDEHGRGFARADGFIETPHHFRHALLPAADAMKPIHDGVAFRCGRGVFGGRVDEVAHLGLHRRTVEGFLPQMLGGDGRLDP